MMWLQSFHCALAEHVFVEIPRLSPLLRHLLLAALVKVEEVLLMTARESIAADSAS